MGTFVISKRYNGDYKFVFATRKGKTIFTSIACKHKLDCEQMIAGIKENMVMFAFTKIRKASNKHFFRLSKDGLVLAHSRKFSTELMLQKGINEIINYAAKAEVLDFSENNFSFSNYDDVFENEVWFVKLKEDTIVNKEGCFFGCIDLPIPKVWMDVLNSMRLHNGLVIIISNPNLGLDFR